MHKSTLNHWYMSDYEISSPPTFKAIQVSPSDRVNKNRSRVKGAISPIPLLRLNCRVGSFLAPSKTLSWFCPPPKKKHNYLIGKCINPP